MAEIILSTMQIKRGLKANLPTLLIGEPAYCTDTKEYFIGTAEGNILINGGGTGGGSVPSNVILFEDWGGGESVTIDTSTAPPTDTTAPVLTISPAGGNFASTQGVTMTTNETANIYYTLDGSTPTTASTKYTAALSLSATTTLKAFAVDTAGNSSAVQTVTFTKDVSAPADTTAPVVTASPAAGTFTSAQSVTLTANEAATIYYTTNGTTPTSASSVYSAPINISATTTLQYMAKDTAGNQSVPVAATYTINLPDTTPPLLTITPAAGTFTTTQTVTMSTEVGAEIFYTQDGSTPTASSTKYTTPLTISTTTTLKAFARDTAGNISAIQTVNYTISAPITINDSFNRTDNSSSLGITDTGQTWEALRGTWGIKSNQAALITSVMDNVAVVDAGSPDVIIQVKLSTIVNSGRVVFRAEGSYSFFAYQPVGSNYRLYRFPGTQYATSLGESSGVTAAAGDVLKVVLNGSSIKLYVNDVLAHSVTDSTYQTATKHGIGVVGSTTERFDNFSITN